MASAKNIDLKNQAPKTAKQKSMFGNTTKTTNMHTPKETETPQFTEQDRSGNGRAKKNNNSK